MSLAAVNAGRLALDNRLGVQEYNEFEWYSDSSPWRNGIFGFLPDFTTGTLPEKDRYLPVWQLTPAIQHHSVLGYDY